MRRMIPLVLMLALLCGCTQPGPAVTAAPTATPTAPPTAAAPPAALVLPYYAEEGVHPILDGNRTNLNLAPLVYEGLFEVDGHFAPKGVLCTGAVADAEGLVWTLTLKEAEFAPGVPMTAADVVYSLTLAMSGESLYAARLGGIKTVKETGDGGVTITLHAPNGNLPVLLDVPVIRPTEGGGWPLGTGEYLPVAEGEGMALRRKAGRGAAFDRIGLYPVQAADGLVHAFDTREISLVAADLTGTNALGFSGNYEVWDYPTSVLLYMGYNTKKGPCADPAVRRALGYGYDRGAVSKSVLSGHATPVALPVSPVSDCYDKGQAAALEYAPQTAADGLTAAGWAAQESGRRKGREKLALTMVVNTDNTYKIAVAEAVAADLTHLGVTVELKKLTWEDYNAALVAGEFDLYLGQVKLTADFDLTPLVTGGGTLNYGGYADGETDGLLGAYLAANAADRPAAAANLYRRVGEMAPFTPLCFKNWSALTHWGALTGVNPTQQNLFYGFDGWKFAP